MNFDNPGHFLIDNDNEGVEKTQKRRFVGNIIEIDGKGVLILGLFGKSMVSQALVMKYQDVYLIADDYCNVIDHFTYHIEKPGKKKIVNRLIGVDDKRQPSGTIRNPLTLEFSSEFPKKKFIDWLDKKDKKIESFEFVENINKLAGRPAHKHCTVINYIVFFGHELNPHQFVYRLMELKEKVKEESLSDFLKKHFEKFFEKIDTNQEQEAKFFSSITDSCFTLGTPEERYILALFARRTDSRGADFSVYFRPEFDIFDFKFYYFTPYQTRGIPAVLRKADALYNLVKFRNQTSTPI